MTCFLNSLKRHKKGFQYGFVWWMCTRFLPSIPSKHIKNYGLRMLGLQMNKNVHFYGRFDIRSPKGIIIEDGVSIGPNVLLDGRKGLTIRKGAVIAYDAIIWTLNHDYNDEHFCAKGAPVEIGAYSWICSRSIVLPGVSIGEGAVVASNAVVTRDIPPYAIVAGIPANIIGYRTRKKWKYSYVFDDDYVHLI